MLRLSFFFLILFNVHSCFAMYPYPEDLEGPSSYKTRALVSEYSFEKLKKKECGVMTLCFKKTQKSSYDHTASVFEVFHPRKPSELLLSMVYYGGDEDKAMDIPRVDVEIERQVLPKLYRGQSVCIDGTKRDVKASYTKYASWVLPTASLIAAIKMGEEDSTTLNTAKEEKGSADIGAKHSVNYAAKIMRQVGLQNVDFWWWRANSSDALKELVDNYIDPKPSKKWK